MSRNMSRTGDEEYKSVVFNYEEIMLQFKRNKLVDPGLVLLLKRIKRT